MKDLTNPKLIILKGVLFFVAGALAAVALIVRHPELVSAMLLLIAIWCFARCYYFAFYVIERYIDPSFRYSGLILLARHVWRRSAR